MESSSDSQDLSFNKQLEEEHPEWKLDFQELVKEFESEPDETLGWQLVISQDQAMIYQREFAEHSFHMFRARYKLKGVSCDLLMDMVYNLERRRKWEPAFSTMEIVEELGDQYDICYFKVKGPWGISDRDFVQIRKLFQHGDATYLGLKSVVHPEKPEFTDVIRAETLISGYCVRPDPEDATTVILETLSQTDVKGLIPVSIINYFAGRKIANWIATLTQACESRVEEIKQEAAITEVEAPSLESTS
mmetsp:Transcript_38614/g.43862  ORF Transcript_38614/g.43862 Transcript_38614/m.43862 type:complete len:247 (-) Transcript_38614:74-814(-)